MGPRGGPLPMGKQGTRRPKENGGGDPTVLLSRKPQGSFTIDLKYLKTSEGFWLPSSLIFSFTADRSLIPRRFNETGDSESNKNAKDLEKEKTGKVYLNYSNYRINTGLTDDFFDDKNKKK